MCNAIIGIISYLPDDIKIRNNRFKKLCNLIQKCNLIFDNLPIMIIAQNWKDDEVEELHKPNIVCLRFDKLGIVGARNKLREKFLETKYNYLIMLDDDVVLKGGSKEGQEYLRQLNLHKNGFWEFNVTLLKLFAISKDLFALEKFDENINPENEGGFEDRIFVNKLRVKYPQLKYQFNVNGLSQTSIATKDPDSTWYKNQDIKKMRDITNSIIEKLDN